MAMLYPTLGAAVADVSPPAQRGTLLGVYRFWRDISATRWVRCAWACWHNGRKAWTWPSGWSGWQCCYPAHGSRWPSTRS